MQKKSIHIKTLALTSPVIIAPMAGISNLPYRRIMKSFGAGLVYSEMVSANGLIRSGTGSTELLATCPDEKPLGVQLFGDDPQVLALAAAQLKDSVTLLDINMGCPVKKVIRSGAGSALLKEPQRIAAIVRQIRKVYPGPLTVKIRSGWDESSINYMETGHIIEAEGADAITLHPRTRSQVFSGQANWEHIGELKSRLNIPVFGNGDITTAEDALRMFASTGCDAVMIGRGTYGNPWLIEQINQLLAGTNYQPPAAAERYRVALQHLGYFHEMFGKHKTILEMRKHISWYVRGLPGASHFRAALQKADSLELVLQLTDSFFTQHCEVA